MATAPVINFDVLLAPIEGANPSGTDVSTTGLIAELNELRRSDDEGNMGDWEAKERKTANWPKLIKVASETLAAKSKDLRVAAHLSEALVRQFGMAGLRDGVRLMRELQERYWDSAYPAIARPPAEEGAEANDDDENGLEMRAAAVARLDRLLPMPVRFARVTKPAIGDTPLTYADWDKANYLEHELKAKSQEAYDEEVKGGAPTSDVFKRAVGGTPRTFYETFVADLDEAVAEIDALNRASQERYADAEEIPYLTELAKSIEKVNQMVSEIEKVHGPLRAVEEAEVDADQGPEDGPLRRAVLSGEGIPTQPVDRADALERLRAVAGYFRKAEPHSPVTYLVERAIAWAAMPLDRWLAEVVKDEGSLAHIRETLGVKPE